MASTRREESCAVNRASVSEQGHRRSVPKPAEQTPRAVIAREAGLELIRRINRWLIAGTVAAAGLFSLLAAHALPGHTVTTGSAPSSVASQSGTSSGASSASHSSSNAGGSGLQAPAQAPSLAPAVPAPVVSGGS